MSLKTIYFLSLIFLCTTSYSQVEWGINFGGEGSESSSGVATDANNNVYLTGVYNDKVNFNIEENPVIDSSGYTSVFLQKRSPGGKHIWTNFIKQSNIGADPSIYIKGSHIYIYMRSSKYLNYINNPENSADTLNKNGQAMIVKLTLDGNLVWSKSFGNCLFGLEITDMVVNDQEDIYFTCTHTCPLDVDPGEEEAIVELHPSNVPGLNAKSESFVAKYSSSGDFLWVTPIQGNGQEFIYDIEIDKEDNLYISGHFNLDIDFIPEASDSLILEYNEYDDQMPFVAKLDKNGKALWAKKLDQFPKVYSSKLHLSNDESQLIFAVIDASKSSITALDIHGVTQWEKEFEEIRFTSIDNNSENAIYLTGHFYEYADFDPSSEEFILEVANGESTNSSDCFILELNSDGNFVNAVRFGFSGGGGSNMVISPDDHIYVSGGFSGYSTHASHFWGEHIYTTGQYIKNDIYLYKVENNLRGDQSENCNNINIYPNPTSKYLSVHNSFSKAFSIRIFNHLGQIIDTRSEEYNSAIIDVSHLKSGFYTIEVRSRNCESKLKFCKL